MNITPFSLYRSAKCCFTGSRRVLRSCPEVYFPVQVFRAIRIPHAFKRSRKVAPYFCSGGPDGY